MQAPKIGNHNASIFALLCASVLLLLPGCPLHQSMDEAGTGFVSLTITGQGTAQQDMTRAILPESVRQGDFDRIDLVFSRGAGTEEITLYAPTPRTVELPVGGWELEVIAFKGTEPVAKGTAQFTVIRDSETSVTVMLSPIPGGYGTFTWDISFLGGNIHSASMEVRYFGMANLHDSIDLLAKRDGSIYMPAALYQVIIRVYNNEGQSTVLREALHIYRGMESRLEHIFEIGLIPVPLQYIILRAWGDPIPDRWNFAHHGIRAGHFGLLVNGVTEANFTDDGIIYWFNRLSYDYEAPRDLDGLRVLVDAALLGLRSRDAAFILGLDFQNQDAMRAALEGVISPPFGNGSPVDLLVGNVVTVTIGGIYDVVIVPPDVGITLSPLYIDFGEVVVGYSPVPPREVTVTSVGSAPTGNLSVELSGVNASAFILDSSLIPSIVSRGETDTFTVRPHDRLPAGEYTATVTVSGSYIPPQSLEVRFMVTPLPPPIAVIVTPNPASVQRGQEQLFTARVYPVEASQAITWNVEPTTGGTLIGRYTGLLTVGTGAPEQLIVTATTVDTSETGSPVSGTAIVTLRSDPIVIVTPDSAIVQRGGQQQFSYRIFPEGVFQGVVWCVTPTTGGTSITEQGLLTVGATATGPLTVTVTVANHPDAYDEATVTVAPTITIDQGDIAVMVGETRQFTATVDPNNPPQPVIWTIDEAVDGQLQTTIDSNGVLRVAPGETHTELTVRASLRDHPSAYDTVIVTITRYNGYIILAIGGIPVNIGGNLGFGILDGPQTVTVTNAIEFDTNSIRWFVGDNVTPVGTGPSLNLNTPEVHRNLIGAHFVTVEVEINGVPFSRRVTFTVSM